MTLTINITQECNALIESMERSPGIRFLWSNIKPFIRGKILYTPDTPATRYEFHIKQCPVLNFIVHIRKVITKINETFGMFTQFKSFLSNWNSNYSETARTILLNEDNQRFLRELFTSNEGGILNILGNLSEKGSKSQTEKQIWEGT